MDIHREKPEDWGDGEDTETDNKTVNNRNVFHRIAGRKKQQNPKGHNNASEIFHEQEKERRDFVIRNRKKREKFFHAEDAQDPGDLHKNRNNQENRSKRFMRHFFGSNFKAAELMQYRWRVGAGPSGKRCPKCASHDLQSTSVRSIPKLRSVFFSIPFSSTASQKLGHPVPESNLVSELNREVPQQTHR